MGFEPTQNTDLVIKLFVSRVQVLDTVSIFIPQCHLEENSVNGWMWSSGLGRWTYFQGIKVRSMVFNATFNNTSVIWWQSVLLVEETEVPEENHRPVAIQ
jgi:hypothetical protein